MQLRQAARTNTKIKMALQGSAGSGKTYSALLLAHGLIDNWNKVAIVDTESGSADLYAHLGQYNVLPIHPPFTPEKYMEAIDICLKAGMEVIIVDSISHCWDCLIEVHANMAGNSFTNWSKITPRQNAFIHKILQADAHIVTTMRVKQDYVLNQKDGKYIPEKVGLKAVQRDGVDYEFTLVLDINIKHHATASKDRTNLFMGEPEFIITKDSGKRISDWCNIGLDIEALVTESKTMDELKKVHDNYPQFRNTHAALFTNKKNILMQSVQNRQPMITKFNSNGNFNINQQH